MIRVLVLVLLSGITVRGQTSVPELNLNQSFAYYNNCSFSAANFNSTCLLSSCSALATTCPNSANGNCSAVGSVLSACLQQPGAVICGVPVSQKPMCAFSADLQGISAGTAPNALTGTCTLNQGFIYGLPDVSYCVTGSGPYTVNMLANNISSNATYLCNFTGADISALTAPAMDLVLVLSLNATATVDVSADPPTVNTTVNSYNIAIQSSNFNGLEDILTRVFNVSLNVLAEMLSTDQAAAGFLADVAASGLQAAQSGCTGSE